jgi:hypothetical protein
LSHDQQPFCPANFSIGAALSSGVDVPSWRFESRAQKFPRSVETLIDLFIDVMKIHFNSSAIHTSATRTS